RPYPPAHPQTGKSLISIRIIMSQTLREYWEFSKGVSYSVFDDGVSLSRPIRSNLFLDDPDLWPEAIGLAQEVFKKKPSEWDQADKDHLNMIVYTGVMAFAACIDLWQRGSRNSPGTFFEAFAAALVNQSPEKLKLSKHIPLLATAEEEMDAADDDDSSVSTDLVVEKEGIKY
uniref:hypothetical protein n=1 Tax=Brevundimonas sp. TWP2-3-2 TaxID=2804648 RepID=UPI003CF0F0CF